MSEQVQINRKLKIPRDKWLRGEGESESRLLRQRDEKMCCVGIYLEACGVPRSQLLEIGSASHPTLRDHVPAEARWLIGKSGYASPWALSLYESNDVMIVDADDDDYGDLQSEMDHLDIHSNSDRDQRIKDLFAKNGVEVEFV